MIRPGMHVRQSRLALVGLLGLAALMGALAWLLLTPPAIDASPGTATPPDTPLRFVGSQTCAQCHTAEHQAWRGSHHALAMQTATRATVLAPFRGETYTEAGVTTRFSQRDGRYYVHTEGADGRLQEFEVTHALGLSPLQQYLIPLPGGRMQALTIAWDARPRAQGGQRWFHLHAGQNLRAGDELHWTGRQNNWNFMCAECHTTQFKKNFDAQTRVYRSTWSEMNVACESCHGPGSGHVGWAGLSGPERLSDTHKGLALWLGERQQARWTIDPATGNARRSQPPSARRQEVEMCARCHAHRSQIGDDYVHGKPLLDTHTPSLIEKDLYWKDGQMKAEVYNHASFQQSRMYEKGVTCSDCHQPHTLKLRAPGHQTCLQCHAAAKYEAPTHHHHKIGSTGASCIACHMPTTTYMSIDPRHDHSLRVPRPDLSLAAGTPNACTQCHTDRPVSWAARWALQWYPGLPRRTAPLADALLAGERGDPQTLALLFQVLADPQSSPISRATALSRTLPSLSPAQLVQMREQLSDPDPLLRKTAADALASAPLEQRTPWLRPLLADPVKGVRLAAVRWLAGAPVKDWSAEEQARWAATVREYIAVQEFNADRPEAYNNLGTFLADLGDWPRAEAALKQAIALAPELAASRLNLADIYQRQGQGQGQEERAQALIREAISQHPRDAAAHHALGLSLLRQQRHAAALDSLRHARELAPDQVSYGYVYAIALESQGRRRQAIQVLEQTRTAQPLDRAILQALHSFCRREGDSICAQRHAAQLAQLEAAQAP